MCCTFCLLCMCTYKHSYNVSSIDRRGNDIVLLRFCRFIVSNTLFGIAFLPASCGAGQGLYGFCWSSLFKINNICYEQQYLIILITCQISSQRCSHRSLHVVTGSNHKKNPDLLLLWDFFFWIKLKGKKECQKLQEKILRPRISKCTGRTNVYGQGPIARCKRNGYASCQDVRLACTLIEVGPAKILLIMALKLILII